MGVRVAGSALPGRSARSLSIRWLPPDGHSPRAGRSGPLTLRLTALALIVALTLSTFLAISLGPSSIPLDQVWRIVLARLTGGDGAAGVQDGADTIVWLLRVPRVLLAMVVGAGLACAGVALQALVRNPLAEPYLLGVSSGATTGAAAVMLFGVLAGTVFARPLGAFTGAMAAVLIVFWVARLGGEANSLRLILAGVAMGGVFSSITSFLVLAKGDSDAARAVMFWTLGSLASAQWSHVWVPLVVVAAAMLYLIANALRLNAMVAGDEQALALGVDVPRFRLSIIVVASLLTGVLVAVSGVIGFVGLMIPHLVRMAVGADHRRLVPIAALAGALFLLWVDVAARMLIAPTELPLGILTAVLGAPAFIYLMRRHGRRSAG